jgi:hypothetical protein
MPKVPKVGKQTRKQKTAVRGQNTEEGKAPEVKSHSKMKTPQTSSHAKGVTIL